MPGVTLTHAHEKASAYFNNARAKYLGARVYMYIHIYMCMYVRTYCMCDNAYTYTYTYTYINIPYTMYGVRATEEKVERERATGSDKNIFLKMET